jgi:predicted GNAT superfamily acetyltransferase
MESAGIEIRPLQSRDELQACVALQRATWGSDFSDTVPLSILKVSQRVGGVAAGAFSPANELLGFVFGLTGVERGRIVHWSDMLAVVPEARNLGLGRRLKEYQRTVVRELGGEVIYWTYDPLVARNAHLNFNVLGARVAEYVVDMYGITDSVLHGGIPTDRLVVAWPTRDADIDANLAAARRALVLEDCRDAPIVTAEWVAGATGASILPACLRVQIPAAAESLMAASGDEARLWRTRVRDALQWSLAAGYSITAADIDPQSSHGYYLMTKPTRASTPMVRS